MERPAQRTIAVSHSSDVAVARRIAKTLAETIGFDPRAGEEIALAVSELAANLVKHAQGGTLKLGPITDQGRSGILVESEDQGPGIADVDQALADGFSTAGSLGYGLGTVNRLMDEFDISSHRGTPGGTCIVCKRWLREEVLRAGGVNPRRQNTPCPLDFGVATRAHPRMEVNGDAFVIKHWGESALVGVIDGLGHGQFAHRAAMTARQYVESHCDRPLAEIFRGTGRACRATRGVVMALARFDWLQTRLTFAAIGNVEARVFGNPEAMNFIIRRGVLGGVAPNPVVTEHVWQPHYVLVLHSDGLTSHWRREDFLDATEPATVLAQRLLHRLAKEEDDATVVVVRGQVR